MSYLSPERQRIADIHELGSKLDGFIKTNGKPRPIGVKGSPPLGHPAAQTFDDGYTGLPDDGVGRSRYAE